jgi:drug/metabolite transporter (DMT)-like permease
VVDDASAGGLVALCVAGLALLVLAGRAAPRLAVGALAALLAAALPAPARSLDHGGTVVLRSLTRDVPLGSVFRETGAFSAASQSSSQRSRKRRDAGHNQGV